MRFGIAAIVAAIFLAVMYAVYKVLPGSLAATKADPAAQAAAKLSGAGLSYMPGTSGLSPDAKASLIAAALKDGAATAGGAFGHTQGNTMGPTLAQLGVNPAVAAGLVPASLGDNPTSTSAIDNPTWTDPTVDPLSLTPSIDIASASAVADIAASPDALVFDTAPPDLVSADIGV